MLLNRGFCVKTVSFMLGHSFTIITTDVYYDKCCLVIDFATNFNKIFKELQLI